MDTKQYQIHGTVIKNVIIVTVRVLSMNHNNMKKLLISTLFLFPFLASASTLSAPQVNSILGLLQAFGVSQEIISNVYTALMPTQTVSTTTQASVPNPTPTQIVYVPVYRPASIQTSATVFGSTVQEPVASAAPVVPVPTCTLTLSKASKMSSDEYALQWESKNLIEGIKYDASLQTHKIINSGKESAGIEPTDTGIWIDLISSSTMTYLSIANGGHIVTLGNNVPYGGVFKFAVTGGGQTGVCTVDATTTQ